jgi:hypothetical protein
VASAAERELERREPIRDRRALAAHGVAVAPARRRDAEPRVAGQAHARGVDHELAADQAVRRVAVVDQLPDRVLGAHRRPGRRRGRGRVGAGGARRGGGLIARLARRRRSRRVLALHRVPDRARRRSERERADRAEGEADHHPGTHESWL